MVLLLQCIWQKEGKYHQNNGYMIQKLNINMIVQLQKYLLNKRSFHQKNGNIKKQIFIVIVLHLYLQKKVLFLHYNGIMIQLFYLVIREQSQCIQQIKEYKIDRNGIMIQIYKTFMVRQLQLYQQKTNSFHNNNGIIILHLQIINNKLLQC